MSWRLVKEEALYWFIRWGISCYNDIVSGFTALIRFRIILLPHTLDCDPAWPPSWSIPEAWLSFWSQLRIATLVLEKQTQTKHETYWRICYTDCAILKQLLFNVTWFPKLATPDTYLGSSSEQSWNPRELGSCLVFRVCVYVWNLL